MLPTTPRPGLPDRGAGIAWAAGTALLLVLVPVAATSVLAAVGVVLAVGLIVLVVVVGTDRAALVCLSLAYLTAPAYKGLATSPSARVTPTDLLLVVGFGLLLPTLARRRLRLPVPYLVGVYLVLVASTLASLLSPDPVVSLGALALWLIAMVALPVALAWWNPTSRAVDVLVWSFVVGHCVSTAYALVQGPVYSGRYLGLTTHPNYFGEAGMLGIALLLHQYHRTASRHRPWVWLVGAVCGASVLMSGSRAATAVVVVLLLLVPVVERSVKALWLLLLAGALLVLGLDRLVAGAGAGSALGRFAGEGSATGSDASRQLGLSEGWQRFLDHPLRGNGLIDLFDIHNNFLEVLVGAGVVGLVGYLLVLWSLGRVLGGGHELHRLGYTVLAYVGFGATIPSLNDRAIWTAVALAVLATQPRPGAAPPAPDTAPLRAARPSVPTGTTGGHR